MLTNEVINLLIRSLSLADIDIEFQSIKSQITFVLGVPGTELREINEMKATN